MPHRIFYRGLFILAVLLPAGLRADQPAPKQILRPININVDMTDAGRKMPPVTLDHPAYYFPKVNGYIERGQRVADEVPPNESDMIRQIAVVLANQGYFPTHQVPVDPKAPPGGAVKLVPAPTFLLVFNWGYLNPSTVSTAADVTDETPPTVLNRDRMIALVAGKGADNLQPNFSDYEDMMQATNDNRYFVIVIAYDFDAYISHHKKVQLWVTRISVASPGLTMADVMPQLVVAGGPYYGHETHKPVMIQGPAVNVEIGESVLKEYINPKSSPAPVPAPPPDKKQ
jgi:hypothetical protein